MSSQFNFSPCSWWGAENIAHGGTGGNGLSPLTAPAWAPSDQRSAGGLEGIFLHGGTIQVRKGCTSLGLITELTLSSDKARPNKAKMKSGLNWSLRKYDFTLHKSLSRTHNPNVSDFISHSWRSAISMLYFFHSESQFLLSWQICTIDILNKPQRQGNLKLLDAFILM